MGMERDSDAEFFCAYARAIVDAMPDACIGVGSTGSIIFANEQSCRFLGYHNKEIIGVPFSSIARVDCAYGEDACGTSPYVLSAGVWRGSDGQEKSVLFSLTTFTHGPYAGSKMYIARDISEYKKTEEALINAYFMLYKAQEELLRSEKMAAIGRIAGGVAHEIRNPLAIILQGIGIIDTLVADKSPDVQETIGMMRESVGRANNVITRLMEYSRSTSALDVQRQDIKDIINAVFALHEKSLAVHQIHVVKNFCPDVLEIMADTVALSQVFLHLADAALVSMPSGGTVSITTMRQDAWCVVEFGDTGAGMNEEQMRRVLEPLGAISTFSKGPGLALSVIRLVVERHGGSMHVRSQAGTGTTFILRLPLVSGEATKNNA